MFNFKKKALIKIKVKNDDIYDFKESVAQAFCNELDCEDDYAIDDIDDESCIDDTDCDTVNIKSPDVSEEKYTEIISEGVLSRIGDRLAIKYAHADIDDMPPEVTTLSFEQAEPSIITMERNSLCRTMMVFEAGKRYLCVYKVGEMSMDLVVRTYELENTLSEDGGEILLGYTLENGGSTVSSVKMQVNVELI